MGCFDTTCFVSHHAIKANEPVAMFLLKRSGLIARHGYDEDGYREPLKPSAMWSPIGPPIFGKYNDYGWVEGVEATQSLQFLAYAAPALKAPMKLASSSPKDQLALDLRLLAKAIEENESDSLFFKAAHAKDEQENLRLMPVMVARDVYEHLADLGLDAGFRVAKRLGVANGSLRKPIQDSITRDLTVMRDFWKASSAPGGAAKVGIDPNFSRFERVLRGESYSLLDVSAAKTDKEAYQKSMIHPNGAEWILSRHGGKFDFETGFLLADFFFGLLEKDLLTDKVIQGLAKDYAAHVAFDFSLHHLRRAFVPAGHSEQHGDPVDAFKFDDFLRGRMLDRIKEYVDENVVELDDYVAREIKRSRRKKP